MLKINRKISYSKPSYGFVVSVLISIFFIMKMLRSFSDSDVVGGFWNYIQIGLVLMGIIIIIFDFSKLYKDSIFLILFGYTALSMLHSLFFLDFKRNDLFNYLMIAFPLCLLVVFYKVDWKIGLINTKIVTTTYYVISAIFIGFMLQSGEYSTSTGAVADVYYILGLIPIILIYTKKHKIIPLLVSAFAVLISAKRTGIVLFLLMVAAFYIIIGIQSKRDIFKRFKNLFAFGIILFVFIILFDIINSEFNEYLLYKIEKMLYENDTAGRDLIWKHLIGAMSESSLFNWFLGHGDGAVSDLLGTNAHNDFLEILYNMGLVPCILYIAFYIQCIIEAIKMFKMNYEYTAHFVMSIICSIGVAMFSFYFIAPTYVICGMICITLILKDFRNKISPNNGVSKMKKIYFTFRR